MDFLNDRDVMPIVGFYGPKEVEYESLKGWKTPDYLTDRYYEMIKESGINLINYTEMDYAEKPAAVLKSLRLAEKYNICMYVIDTGLRPDMAKEEMRGRMNAYSQFRCFKGIHVCDEPGSPDYGPKKRMLADYYTIMQKINSFENLVGAMNLFAFHPDWIGYDNDTIWLDRPHYEAYVEEYCRNCAPKMLSADYYIFDGHAVETSKDYFENLEILDKYAQKYDIPFWMYIQLGGQWNDGAKQQETVRYYPRPEEVIWNVNTSLAGGAKGIAYFPLLQPYYFAFAPDGEMDFGRNGLINANGEKSAWFDCVKEANSQIRAVGKYLLKMTHRKMIAKGHYAELNLPDSVSAYRELTSVELKDRANRYGTIIGCFEYGGKSAFYVVNNDTTEAQSITLQFDQVYFLTLVSSEREKAVQRDSVTLHLDPASAALVLMRKKGDGKQE